VPVDDISAAMAGWTGVVNRRVVVVGSIRSYPRFVDVDDGESRLNCIVGCGEKRSAPIVHAVAAAILPFRTIEFVQPTLDDDDEANTSASSAMMLLLSNANTALSSLSRSRCE